jgi:hypothetical protein
MVLQARGDGIAGSKSRIAIGAPISEASVSRTPLATTHAALVGNDERSSKSARRTRLPQ